LARAGRARRERGAPTRTKNIPKADYDLRTQCEESAASRRGLCDLRTRCEESAGRRLGPKKSPTQSGLRDLRTRCEESAASRRGLHDRATRSLAEYLRSERDAKRAWCADADQKNVLIQSGLFNLRTRCEESAANRRGLFDLRTRYEESAANRRGLFDLRTRYEESAARRRGPKKCPNPIHEADAFLIVRPSSVERRRLSPSAPKI